MICAKLIPRKYEGGDTRRGGREQEVDFPRRESLPFTHCDSSRAHPLALKLTVID